MSYYVFCSMMLNIRADSDTFGNLIELDHEENPRSDSPFPRRLSGDWA